MSMNLTAAIKQYAYDELLRHPDDSVKIKSERELCVLYGVSRPTVRKALSELEREGVLIIRHGSGAFTNPAAAIQRSNPQGKCSVGILLGFGNSLVFDSYYWEIINAAQRKLGKNGMVVLPVLQLIGEDEKAAEEILRLKLDAVLWIHPSEERIGVIRRLEAEGLPVACVGRDPGEFAGTVMFDYLESGRNLGRFFLSKGIRKPLFAVNSSQQVYFELAQGFVEEMSKAGANPDLRCLLLEPERLESAVKRLHAEKVAFDGAFVFAQFAWELEKTFDQYFGENRFKQLNPVVVQAVHHGWPNSPFLNIDGCLLGALAGEYLAARINGKPFSGNLRPMAEIVERRSMKNKLNKQCMVITQGE